MTTPFSYKISNQLKTFRLSHQFSQAKMAEFMCLSTSQYNKLENGTCILNLFHLEHLADSLNMSLNELLSHIFGKEGTGTHPNPEILDTVKYIKDYCRQNRLNISISSAGEVIIREDLP